MRARFAIVLCSAAALAACGRGGDEAPRVEARQVVVTLAAAPGRPGAAYFRLETNREGTRLVRLSSPAARRIELHEAGMQPAEAFAFSAAEPLVFAPGGRHAMLFDLDPSLRPGERIALAFTFEGAPPLTAEAEVRAPGDVPMQH